MNQVTNLALALNEEQFTQHAIHAMLLLPYLKGVRVVLHPNDLAVLRALAPPGFDAIGWRLLVES